MDTSEDVSSGRTETGTIPIFLQIYDLVFATGMLLVTIEANVCVQALSTLSSQGVFSVSVRRTDARHHQKHIHKDANNPWEIIHDPPRTLTYL